MNKYAILLDKYKSIYILIPKAGTSSMKYWCSEILDLNINIKDIHKTNLPYISKTQVTNNKYKNYYKFTFVRDPWDRIVSCYEDKVKDRKQKPAYNGNIFPRFRRFKEINKKMTFKEFVTVISKIPDSKSDTHFVSQYYLLKKNKSNLLLPNYIGKLENIQSDLKQVLSAIKINPKVTLKHLHRLTVDKTKYRNYYTPYTKDLIYKRYKKDINYFKYDF